MKPIFYFLLFALAFPLAAQQTDYDAIVQPLDAKAREFPEYLVQLAWLNSPDGAIALEEVKNTRDQAQNTRKEWLRDVQMTFNLNEGNLRPASATNNAFFPKYNFALNLNVYNILTQKNKSKIGKREVTIAELQVNKRKLEVRAETLARYANFRLAKDVYQIRALAEQEMNANFILVEQLYKTDEATFEQYTLASTSFYQAKESRI
ncbi:MAG: TolC family protein, partial [Saprospiraceae bacterium]